MLYCLWLATGERMVKYGLVRYGMVWSMLVCYWRSVTLVECFKPFAQGSLVAISGFQQGHASCRQPQSLFCLSPSLSCRSIPSFGRSVFALYHRGEIKNRQTSKTDANEDDSQTYVVLLTMASDEPGGCVRDKATKPLKNSSTRQLTLPRGSVLCYNNPQTHRMAGTKLIHVTATVRFHSTRNPC